MGWNSSRLGTRGGDRNGSEPNRGSDERHGDEDGRGPRTNDEDGRADSCGPGDSSSGQAVAASSTGKEIAGAGDDRLLAKAGFAEIHGGAGFDIFKFDDLGVLDLSTLGGRMTGIEQVDISGTGNVELKLTFQDLLTMTDSGHPLIIVGDSGDKVSADLSGHDVAVADMGAFTRYVIDGGAATLDIDNNVQKNIIGI